MRLFAGLCLVLVPVAWAARWRLGPLLGFVAATSPTILAVDRLREAYRAGSVLLLLLLGVLFVGRSATRVPQCVAAASGSTSRS
jgi:hypothetical protein